MADKNFKVKSGLNIPITSAAILTTDASGNISSTAVLPITAGGTGQTSATNAINALLPVQNGSTVNYVIQSDGSNINWGKLYNQTIKNNGTTVTPRGIVNIVGATFADDSGTDTTTITFTDTTGVSTSGGSTITTSSASTKGLIIKGSASQTANLTEWRDSSNNLLASMSSSGRMLVDWLQASVLFNNYIVNYFDNGPYFYMTNTNTSLVNRNTTSNVIFTIKGMSGQTGDLQQWRQHNDVIGTKIGPYGELIGSNTLANSIGPTISGVMWGVTAGLSSYIPVVVRGATSQTADLQQWQNSSGTVNARIDAYGTFQNGTAGGYGAWINVQPAQASDKGIIIRGAASQTADLQQWQNSSGTVLSKVDSSGSMFTTTATAGTNTTQVATTAFVKTAIDNLIASAPGTLDTLDEIAQALNDDPNFYTTITTLTNALAEQDSYTLMGVF